MKLVLKSLIATSVCAGWTQTKAADEGQLDIVEVQITEVEQKDEPMASFATGLNDRPFGDCSAPGTATSSQSGGQPDPGGIGVIPDPDTGGDPYDDNYGGGWGPPISPPNPANEVMDLIDRVVNTLDQVWNLIAENRPTVELTSTAANALPQGLHCWQDLENWQIPRTKLFHVDFRNRSGHTAVSFDYSIVFVYGGSIDGRGQFIASAKVTPKNISVRIPYKLNVNVEVPTVLNMGSRENPVAGMQMLINWKVSTLFRVQMGSENFMLKGDGDIIHLEGQMY